MDSRAISTAVLVNFLLLSAASAFNITKLLSQFPDFTNFNDLLTQTKLADEINSRLTLTVLGLDNGAVSSLSGKPLDVVKRILSVHVLLDYYDTKKLATLASDNTSVLTTLFQTTGIAMNQQGFLKVTLTNEGEVAFGSAVKGAQAESKLLRSVAAQPYNISVLQITSPIQVPGIDSKPSHSTPLAPPPKASAPVQSPKKAPAPAAKSPSKADAPAAKSPSKAPAPYAKSPSKADAPGARSPSRAHAPGARSPSRAHAPGARSPSRAQAPGARSPSSAQAPGARSPSSAHAPGLSPKSAADSPESSSPNPAADSPASSPPKPAADSPDATDDDKYDAAAPGPSDDSGASSGRFIGAATVLAVISSFLAL
ncbi:fasciclin-like arabinogalactan protein 14 isoform X2 [Cucurbita maxima]|uniref:Fasciclin-like arabinogalactan protein 14 isoform X2 n=1 Tax=Cucurbita maxima TaxID=3661 RepID=A0A6J1J2T5_CUCMA|nr:fasciclin-like arabinogalactan protein 14 isoform X2 [Cucurbita maxima]